MSDKVKLPQWEYISYPYADKNRQYADHDLDYIYELFIELDRDIKKKDILNKME